MLATLSPRSVGLEGTAEGHRHEAAVVVALELLPAG
jgi:hypothetical protein